MPVTGTKFVFLNEEKPVFLPIWREVFMGVDWAKLHMSPAYYGLGLPHGDGSPVVTVPGFLGHDLYLREMNLWLNRIGYTSYSSRIGHNAECPDILVDRLVATIQRAHSETGLPVHLVGHSLGGLLSRGAAVMAPDLVASVTTLGSPFRGIRGHPSVLRSSKFVRKRIEQRRNSRPSNKPMRQACYTLECDCPFAQAIRTELAPHIFQSAIYTKTDGIVDWAVCITGDPDSDFEVKGTHCGLAFNAEVYGLIAARIDESRALSTGRSATRANRRVPLPGSVLA